MSDRFIRTGAPEDVISASSSPRPVLLQHFSAAGSAAQSSNATFHSRLLDGTGSGLDTWMASAAAASIPGSEAPGAASLTLDAPSAPAQQVNAAWILPLTARRTQLHGQLLEAELLGSRSPSAPGAYIASPIHDRASLLSAAHATEDDGPAAAAAAAAITRHRATAGASRSAVLFPRGDDVSRQLHAEEALLASAVAVGAAQRPRNAGAGDAGASDPAFALAAAATAQAARAGLSPVAAGEVAASAMAAVAAAAGSARLGLPAALGIGLGSSAALSGSTVLGVGSSGDLSSFGNAASGASNAGAAGSGTPRSQRLRTAVTCPIAGTALAAAASAAGGTLGYGAAAALPAPLLGGLSAPYSNGSESALVSPPLMAPLASTATSDIAALAAAAETAPVSVSVSVSGGTPPKRPRVLTPSDLPVPVPGGMSVGATASSTRTDNAHATPALPAMRSPPGSPRASSAAAGAGTSSSPRQTPGRASVRSTRSSLLSSPGRALAGASAAHAAAVVVSPGRVQMRIVRPAPPPPPSSSQSALCSVYQGEPYEASAGAAASGSSLPGSAPPSWRSVPSRGAGTPGRSVASTAASAAFGAVTPGRGSISGSMQVDGPLGTAIGSSSASVGLGSMPGTPSRRMQASAASVGAELAASLSLAASGVAAVPSDLDVAQGSGAAFAGAVNAAVAAATAAAAGSAGLSLTGGTGGSSSAVDLGATGTTVASLLSLGSTRSARSSLTTTSQGAGGTGGFGASAAVSGTPQRRPNMVAAAVTASGGAASVASHASHASLETAAGVLRATSSWFGGSVAACLTPGRAGAAAAAAAARDAQVQRQADVDAQQFSPTATPQRRAMGSLAMASPGRATVAGAAATASVPLAETVSGGNAVAHLAMASPPRARRQGTPGKGIAGTVFAGAMRTDDRHGDDDDHNDDDDDGDDGGSSVARTAAAAGAAAGAAGLVGASTPWATPAAVAAMPAAALLSDRALTLSVGQGSSAAAAAAALVSPGRAGTGGALTAAAVRASTLLAAGAPSLGPSAVAMALAEGQSLVSPAASGGRASEYSYSSYDGTENAVPAAALAAVAATLAHEGASDGPASPAATAAYGATAAARPATTAAVLHRRAAASAALQHSRFAPLLSPAGQALLAPSPVAAAHASAAAAAAAAAASSPADAAAAAAALQHRPPRRVIPRLPFKVLDAPALPDDFYCNPLHWGSGNLLAVGLSADLYLWSGHTSSVERLASYALPPASSPQQQPPPPNAGATISSVRWAPRGEHVAVGLSTGAVEVWDAAAQTVVRRYDASQHGGGRVPSLAWSGQTLASGGKDGSVLLRDARDRSGAPYASLHTHAHEVCGLEWSLDGEMLASGSNDNRVAIWASAAFRPPPRTAAMRGAGDASAGDAAAAIAAPAPLWKFTQFTAAVKALAWSPHERHLLAAGGGTNDKKIRFLSSASGEVTGAVDTGAQVAQLAWCPHAPELASALGFSQNALVIWRYPSMSRLANLMGHTSRVLFMSLAPDGQVIVTGAGDETLRFWAAFPPPGSYWRADDARGGAGGAAAVASPAAAPADGHISSLLLSRDQGSSVPANTAAASFSSPIRNAAPVDGFAESPLRATWSDVR